MLEGYIKFKTKKKIWEQIKLKERVHTQVTGLHGKGYHGIEYGAVRFESFFDHFKEVPALLKRREMKQYDKLVRDRIPEIIELDGSKCNFHVATTDEFKSRLIDKLGEEIAEFVEKPSAEEMADILEVLDAVRRVYEIDLGNIKHQKVMKRVNRGGFEKRFVLESTTDNVKSVEKYRNE